ncbi:hypothetical protein GETHLI_11810 [Geothrix limicola]|uniref:Cupin domain-containing protein n=1 Tax=Geothrix limicola TaxID=2927978 RepID=A0ABQ5QDM0_9BACT|nr:hypothetical protein GETHLI_11810 [Geothrix limicola]
MLLLGSGRAQEPAAPPILRKALLLAQVEPGKRTDRVEIQEITLKAGMKAPLHLHPCPVVGLVTAGAICFQIEGGPVQHLKPGEAFFEPAMARVVHFDPEGSASATFIAAYLLEAGDKETIRLLPR